MGWGFDSPLLPSPSLTLPFLILTILSLITTSFTLLFVLSFGRDAAHPVLLSFLLSYLIYLVGGSLVSIQQHGHITIFPEFTICLVQGSMMEAGSPALTAAVSAFNFSLWVSMQDVSKRLTAFVRSRLGTFLLVAFPWAIWIVIFSFCIATGLKRRETVYLHELYCVVHLEELSKARFSVSLIFIIASILFAVAISNQVFRNYGKTSKDDRRASLKMVAEAWGLALYLLVLSLLVVRAKTAQSSVEADLTAVAGGIFILLLGNQVNLYDSTSWKVKISNLRTNLSTLPAPRTFLPSRSNSKNHHPRQNSLSSLGRSILSGRTIGRGRALSKGTAPFRGDSSTTLTGNEIPEEYGGEVDLEDDGGSRRSARSSMKRTSFSGDDGKDTDLEVDQLSFSYARSDRTMGDEEIGLDVLEGTGKKKEKKKTMQIKVEVQELSEAMETEQLSKAKRVYR